MAAEVANNQAVSAPAPEEKEATEKKVEEVEAAVKDGDAAPAKSDETVENAGDAPAAAAPAKTVAPKLTVHKADFEKDVIYLYQFSRTPFLPSISPYCLKVETWLRLAGLKYEVNETKRREKYIHTCWKRKKKTYYMSWLQQKKKSHIHTFSFAVCNFGMVLSHSILDNIV